MDTSRASRVDGVMTMATADPPFLTHGIAADDCDDADDIADDDDVDDNDDDDGEMLQSKCHDELC